MATGLAPRLTLRFIAIGYLVALVMVPLGMIFYRTFENGFGAFWEQVTTPAGISALNLSLIIVAIVGPAERDLRRDHGAGAGARQLPRQARDRDAWSTFPSRSRRWWWASP